MISKIMAYSSATLPNGGALGRARAAQSVYQPSSGEKHVLFYPTSPAPSEERRTWSQASSNLNNAATHRFSTSAADTLRMEQQHQSRIDAAKSSDAVQYGPFRLGIHGWRKRCLYALVLGLLIMVIINLALTLWVLKVMEFSSDGMGQLRIVPGGLQLTGRTMVLDRLLVSSIRARSGQPITVESTRNITLSARDEHGALGNQIFIGNDRFECKAKDFRVLDDRGEVLFSANRNEVVVGAETLRVTGSGGIILDGSVQTSLVRAFSGHELKLESLTRSLELRAPSAVNIEARAGDIRTSSYSDIRLQSLAGAIHLDAATILLPKLPLSQANKWPSTSSSISSSSSSTSSKSQDIYQLCSCSNGKLFLAAANKVCADDKENSVCR